MNGLRFGVGPLAMSSNVPGSGATVTRVAPAGWRILLSDDHVVVRAGLRALLAADVRCKVVGEASSIEEMLTAARHLRPDLIVLDVSFGRDNALEALPDLLTLCPDVKVVVLTMHDDVASAREAFARGAHGYLMKEAAADDLMRAVEAVMSGSTYLQAELGARLARAGLRPADDLSPREREVLALLARGYTNAEAAHQLLVSLRTVETHRAHLRTRLGINSRAEIVDAAHRLGLLP
jgi:two-component system response regulator NreC